MLSAGVPLPSIAHAVRALNEKVKASQKCGGEAWRVLLESVDYKWPLHFQCPVPGADLIPLSGASNASDVRAPSAVLTLHDSLIIRAPTGVCRRP